MNDLFFELIRLSIGSCKNLSRKPSADEWNGLYKMAVKQSLVGICFVGVRRFIESFEQNREEAGIPMKIYFQWLGTAAHIQQRNELMNQRCVELQSELKSYGLRSSILKGQSVAALYGDLKDFRQPGDIDVYVDCGRQKSIEFARALGQNKIDWDYKHLHLNIFKDAEVELHYRADVSCNLLKNYFLQKFWKQQNESFFERELQLDYGVITSSNDTMHIFYLIHHAYRHIISGGLGLRQIMDLYYALENRDVSKDARLKVWIEKHGLKKISEAIMWLLVDVFGANADLLPWCLNEKEGQFLLEEIMIGGNFGKADKRYGSTSNNRFSILVKVFRRNIHLIWHYGSDAMLAPIYYMWHFCWKRLAKKY